MRKFLLMSCVGGFALLANGAAFANEELIQLSKDPKQWVMPTGDYFNQRYSKLSQINSDNVKRLVPLWTFSTGVLRGHEG
ncbi:MAG TPA: PQQ-dependent dehydrogenase, methanol/ethanol family, partial [Methylocella sp.]|nr:PQQ-dependent dehydrogenase, methanol/ethanol family [Methylocella sp.]